ncbi:MAG TPA: DapH/DapD/GlmU-related protein, partial [Pirellula sp.]|nr:DapH/DapD/GlmU-related protein [Pirellula sp.]
DASGSPMRAMGPSKPIFIGENAWIGMRAIILGGAHIGEGAIVGAGAVVDCVVTPYSIVAGNPAVIVGQARQRQ